MAPCIFGGLGKRSYVRRWVNVSVILPIPQLLHSDLLEEAVFRRENYTEIIRRRGNRLVGIILLPFMDSFLITDQLLHIDDYRQQQGHLALYSKDLLGDQGEYIMPIHDYPPTVLQMMSNYSNPKVLTLHFPASLSRLQIRVSTFPFAPSPKASTKASEGWLQLSIGHLL